MSVEDFYPGILGLDRTHAGVAAGYLRDAAITEPELPMALTLNQAAMILESGKQLPIGIIRQIGEQRLNVIKSRFAAQ